MVSRSSSPTAGAFLKDTLIKGQRARVECVSIGGQTFCVDRGVITVVRLDDEWFHEVRDPAHVIAELTTNGVAHADLFTFCQRLPHTAPMFPYTYELESIAALPIQTYEQWWNTQIESSTRNKIRKARKLGVDVRVCAFDDDFVRGMTSIFNETPVRQGRRFWHFGKDFDTVKRDFSRFLFREDLVGAYFRDELIGFVMLGKGAEFADLGQIVSKVAHRDKAPNNALIAKAVELCSDRGIRHLVYAFWSDDSLGQFKRESGFRETQLPRYWIPLTLKGRVALGVNAHKPVRTLLPQKVVASLKRARTQWDLWRTRHLMGEK